MKVKTAVSFLLIVIVSVTLQAQKYIVYYNSGKYAEAIEACNKILEKDKSELQVYLYKSLSYMHLGTDTATAVKNKTAIEKSLSAYQVIVLRDKPGNFISAHSQQIDSVITLSTQAAELFFETGDIWNAKRITDILIKYNPGFRIHYLQGRILISESDTYSGIQFINLAAKQIYEAFQNGVAIDTEWIAVYTDLADNMYATGDMHSALIIMDRSRIVFPEYTSTPAYIRFIDSINNQEGEYASDSVYISLLKKLDTFSITANDDLRWHILSNRLKSYINYDLFCKYNYTISDIIARYSPGIKDSVLVFYVQNIIDGTQIQIRFGKAQIEIDSCFTTGVLQLCNTDSAITEALSEILHNYSAVGNLHDAAILIYNLTLQLPYPDEWKIYKQNIITELQHTFEAAGYDYEILKLLFLFETDKSVKTFTYTTSQKLAGEYIQQGKFSEAGALIRMLSQQNPNDAATKQLEREWVTADYQQTYLLNNINDEDLEWTGNYNECKPGTIGEEAQQKFLTTLNYFRRLAGVPDSCVLSDSLNVFCQYAAFVMDVNNALSHGIDKEWDCYSQKAFTGASNSNLSLGYHSTDALYGQLEDSGGNNQSVGHRRWILNPYRRVFGHGSTPDAMALWALGGRDTNFDEKNIPDYSSQYVLWPPKGFVPAEFYCNRWSVSIDGADFSNASVKVMIGKKTVPVTIYPLSNGYGLPTLVFSMDEMVYNIQTEITYEVEIAGISFYNKPAARLKYSVTFIPIAP